MFRLLAFLVVLAAAVWGMSWLAAQPGEFAVSWGGPARSVSLLVGLGLLLAVAVGFALIVGFLRFLARIPGQIVAASRARRREKGLAALSRGMIAVGAGDARQAQRCALDADRFIGEEPLVKLLRAQAAQLSGDRAGAAAAFTEMLTSEETHLLGLRGLHVEARRAGDAEAAISYARRASARARLPWAAQAVLEDYVQRGDWAKAIETVEANAAARLIDKPTANRWRAVLKTALAQERGEKDARGSLALARDALDLAPGLVPAAVIAARMAAATGDARRASRMLEQAWRESPHPDIASAYLSLRPGDSAADRLTRARTLQRAAPNDPESALTLARAALEARDFETARGAIASLSQADGGLGRPTARACLLSSEIEEAAGDEAAARAWLARAARAPRDRAWVAEGIISDRWAPASPDGRLDAFVWRTPDERIAQEPPPPLPPRPEPAAVSAPPSQAAVETRPAPRAAPRLVAATPIGLTNAPDDPGPARGAEDR